MTGNVDKALINNVHINMFDTGKQVFPEWRTIIRVNILLNFA